MAKNIVLCLDGTWNGKDRDEDDDGIPEDTNVLRLYRCLAGAGSAETRGLADEDERVEPGRGGSPAQVAKYLHGVGDSGNPIVKMVGGAFGAGLIRRVVRAYTFICRNYQPGDRICIVGFSRGAYSARALGGMIARAGLMDYERLGNPSKTRAYRHGIYVWAYYRQGVCERNEGIPSIVKLWERVVHAGEPVGEEHMIRDVPIEMIAVWDTVGALGIPRYDRNDRRVDLLQFADLDLSPRVKRGLHALALDEYRRDFTPALWNRREGIEQVWFVGAHADVGGGYEETGLSDIALGWIVRGLAGAGVLFRENAPAGDPLDPLHDSWNTLPFKVHDRITRSVEPDAHVHRSCAARMEAPGLDYRPAALDGWRGTFVN